MRRKHRIRQLIEFYKQSSDQAVHRGETYMAELTVDSLYAMVGYKYPKLTPLTRMSYAQELFALLKDGKNKRFWREIFAKNHGHWSSNDTL